VGRILTIGIAAIIGTVIAVAWVGSYGAVSPTVIFRGEPPPPPPPSSPAEARQQEILKANVGQPADPALTKQYAAINAKYFGGQLPDVVVRWEPALADVGPLAGEGVVLQGMYGRAGNQPVILLNPTLRNDARTRERALCHEIVHAYLFARGDDTTTHGPAFQVVLERLLNAGAFEGIAADPLEKARLHAWLDAESASMDAERQAMDVMDARIREMGADLDRAIAEFNARASRPADEAAQLEARRQQYNQLALEGNERVVRDREQLARFNREVARYNLMMAYPDGLDESSLVPAKKAR
jgi:hypothetical protein